MKINACNDGNGNTAVSMKTYVDTRFDAVKIATDAALAAQQRELAAALASQQRELAAQIGIKHDRGLGRQETWGYIVGVVGILSLIATIALLFLKH